MTRIFVYYSIKHEKSLFEIDTVNCEGSGNELSVSRQVCSLNQRNDRHRRPAYRQRDMPDDGVGAKLAEIKSADTVAIFGCGPVGLY